MAVVRADGHCLESNQALGDWLGQARAGAPIGNLSQLLHPDDRQRFCAQLAELLAGSQERLQLEARCLHADGSGRWGRLWLSALPAAAGPLALVELVDIQAERELEAAHRAEAQAQAALALTEAIPVGTYTMVQPPGGGLAHFSFMSERFLQICGLQREEAAADPLEGFRCVHPDDYPGWLELNSKAFADRTPFMANAGWW